MESLGYFIYFLFFISLGYFAGNMIERAHYQQLETKEMEFIRMPVVTSKDIEDKGLIAQSRLVTGSVVISLDYFKRFLAGLRKIVGGRIKSYETLLDRGRREAILRMKQAAKNQGADMIINMRFETSGIGTVSKKKDSVGCFEILAYGTAVKLNRKW
ncbi:YbjQ family protein [Candidatus Omnitrophota bacterium]